MSFNEIRREGALAVATSMKNKSNLQLLNLDGMYELEVDYYKRKYAWC